MLNSTADLTFALSELTNHLNTLAFQPDVCERVVEFYNTCEKLQQLITGQADHEHMGNAFRKNIPCLVRLTNQCHHLSQQQMPEAVAYEKLTEALLHVYNFCCSGMYQLHVPAHVKIPHASLQQQSAYFEMQCLQLVQQWQPTKLATLITIAIEPLCAVATATPLHPCSFMAFQEAYKHLHNLQWANTESGLLSVLYGINYNTNQCIDWLLKHQQEQLERLVSTAARRGYIAATIREIKMARFNPHLKTPLQPFCTENPSLEDCMETFFESRFEQVANVSYHTVYETVASTGVLN